MGGGGGELHVSVKKCYSKKEKKVINQNIRNCTAKIKATSVTAEQIIIISESDS